MAKKMLINSSHLEECRLAVVSDGMLEALDVQVKTRESTLGNIYKAKVDRIEPSLQAVFVDYGAEKNGFLSINDVHPSYFPESYETGRRKPRVQDVFEKGSDVLVQVNKEERDHKGASLTTNLSIAGRYLVMMPGAEVMAVSRKIEDERERTKLKQILKQLNCPPNMGFIIRTAGMGQTKRELARDLKYVLNLWSSIERDMTGSPAPCLLHREQDEVVKFIREYFTPDISEILIDDKEAYNKAGLFLRQVMPKHEKLVKLHQEKRPLFNKYQLEEQVEKVYRREIALKSGGYIIIEPTEALVTIDVNSGSATKERDIEETAFKVNLEAADEIARQLRLRDLGGIIVIDFIDMMNKKHKQQVERALKTAMKDDRARAKVLRISQLGLLELSRQRLRPTLGSGEYHTCPLCSGSGRVRAPETLALSVFRKIKSLVIKTDVKEVRAIAPLKVAEYLLNDMRSHIVDMERQYNAKVIINGKDKLPDKDVSVEAIKESEEDDSQQVVEAKTQESKDQKTQAAQKNSKRSASPPRHFSKKRRPKTRSDDMEEFPERNGLSNHTAQDESENGQGLTQEKAASDAIDNALERIESEMESKDGKKGSQTVEGMGKRMSNALSSLRDFLPFS
jgi:ribonuclease E